MRMLDLVSSSILKEHRLLNLTYLRLDPNISWATSVKLLNLSEPQFPQLQNMDIDYTFHTVIFVTTKWNTTYEGASTVPGMW